MHGHEGLASGVEIPDIFYSPNPRRRTGLQIGILNWSFEGKGARYFENACIFFRYV
jgi:hypothetical protein